MKKNILYVFILFTGIIMSAQNVQRSTISSSGSSSVNTVLGETYYVSQSVGQQSVIGTRNAQNYTVRQGFQQPPVKVEVISDASSDLEAIIFPNPVDAWVTIQFGEEVKTPIEVILFDVTGKNNKSLK